MELRGIQVALGPFHLQADVKFAEGITGLFGASGAGKTTLLELIAGLRRPDQGEISFKGQTLVDTQRKIFMPAHKRNIGYVPQDLALFPHVDVQSNILYAEGASKDSASGASFQTICEILEIGKVLRQYPGSLSGGEKQRVAFARALMAGPSFLLLDEPLRGLEDELKDQVLSFLLQIKHEFAIPMLYVTHSPPEVVALCDEVILLEKGELIGQGEPSDYFVPTDTPTYRLKRDS